MMKQQIVTLIAATALLGVCRVNAAGDLQDGWEVVPNTDPDKVYYWNWKTDATQWERPTKGSRPERDPNTKWSLLYQEYVPVEEGKEATSAKLNEENANFNKYGWQVSIHPRTKKFHYFGMHSKMSTSTKPKSNDVLIDGWKVKEVYFDKDKTKYQYTHTKSGFTKWETPTFRTCNVINTKLTLGNKDIAEGIKLFTRGIKLPKGWTLEYDAEQERFVYHGIYSRRSQLEMPTTVDVSPTGWTVRHNPGWETGMDANKEWYYEKNEGKGMENPTQWDYPTARRRLAANTHPVFRRLVEELDMLGN